MLSSFKVIKKCSVSKGGSKTIDTVYDKYEKKDEENVDISEKNAKEFIDSYEILARTMLENARRQSDKVLLEAYNNAQKIEEESSEKGYSKGYSKGYEDGYKDGTKKAEEYYTKLKEKAQEEIEILNKNAENLLNSSKKEYIDYMENKKEEIKSLILTIAESILKKEVKDKEAIGDMILDALECAKKSKSIIIKSRDLYVEDIKNKIDNWKGQIISSSDIFVVEDNNLKEGEAVILKENGKIVLNVEDAMEKVKNIILSQDLT